MEVIKFEKKNDEKNYKEKQKKEEEKKKLENEMNLIVEERKKTVQ